MGEHWSLGLPVLRVKGKRYHGDSYDFGKKQTNQIAIVQLL